jgi:hypothetical protein
MHGNYNKPTEVCGNASKGEIIKEVIHPDYPK